MNAGKEGSPDREVPLTPEELDANAFRLISDFELFFGKDGLRDKGMVEIWKGETCFGVKLVSRQNTQILVINKDPHSSKTELVRDLAILKSKLPNQMPDPDAKILYYRELVHTTDPVFRAANTQSAVEKVEAILSELKSPS